MIGYIICLIIGGVSGAAIMVIAAASAISDYQALLEANKKLSNAKDEQIAALERLVAALKEKIQIIERVDNG